MRISNKGLNKYPWYLMPFFWWQKRKYGSTLEPSLVWARIPRLFLGVATLYGAIDRKSSSISPILRSLITVRISQINSCNFCVDINSATLIKRAGDNQKLDMLDQWSSSDLFSAEEKAALQYAEDITYSDRQVNDQLFKQLKELFREEQIIELTALIGFQNMSSKFNTALDIASQGFCKTR